jgi:hypothetical protein
MKWDHETCSTCKQFKQLSKEERKALDITIRKSPTLSASEDVRRCDADPAGAPRIPENAACAKWER